MRRCVGLYVGTAYVHPIGPTAVWKLLNNFCLEKFISKFNRNMWLILSGLKDKEENKIEKMKNI